MDSITAGNRLARLGGAALAIGGAGGVVVALLLQLINADTPPYGSAAIAARGAAAVLAMVVVLGLPALAVRLAAGSFRLATAGLVLTMIPLLTYGVYKGLAVATLYPLIHSDPWLSRDFTPAIAVLLIGGLAHLFAGATMGAAAFRAGTVSRLCAGLLVLSSVLFLGSFSPIEWFDAASDAALMAGLCVAGLEMLGIGARNPNSQPAAADRTVTV
jgi:hypothetical protein